MFKTVLVSVVAVLALGFCDATFNTLRARNPPPL